MLGAFTLALAVSAADPRPALIELQAEGRHREALARVEQELRSHPEASRRIGLDYLRGHLLEQAGDLGASGEAFFAAMAATPELGLYSRYRLALAQERANHPEVAAGLVAAIAAQAPPASPLLPEAVRLLSRTLEHGGDCRLLRGLRPEAMTAPHRRLVLLNQADCALRADLREFARGLLVSLLEEDVADETARAAAERLARMASEAESGRLPLLLGMAFHQHREFERALDHLRRALGRNSLSEREAFEARYAVGRSHFWQGRYPQAAVVFGELAARARTPEQRARVLYQQGRSYELQGQWLNAVASFRLAYSAEPEGTEWAAVSLFSAMRLEWRTGREAQALAFHRLLSTRREWREPAARAALFLAASDVVRGRSDRARAWLSQAAAGGDAPTALEAAYWRGRLEELGGDERAAVAAYLAALRSDAWHPLSRAARRRLAAEPLARTAAAEARRLAAAGTAESLRDAWLLLDDESAAGRNVARRLKQRLLADPQAGPFLRLNVVPVDRWPLWDSSLRSPEEMLLALGLWREGGPAVPQHFPSKEPSLAFTGSFLMSRAGELARAMRLAEALRIRTPERVPLGLQPREYHEVLYPLPYREPLTAQSRLRGVDPHLLAAVLRTESRFDPFALSPAAARGLGQFTLPTARRLARQIGLGSLDSDDLYRPEVSIALAAAHLSELLQAFGGAPQVAAAAYNAGQPQANLWRSYCNSLEPEEYFSKVTFQETRVYLQRVLTSWAHYEDLY
jgi:soluble lytic murein transglycosylase